jgi:hypothetical protein
VSYVGAGAAEPDGGEVSVREAVLADPGMIGMTRDATRRSKIAFWTAGAVVRLAAGAIATGFTYPVEAFGIGILVGLAVGVAAVVLFAGQRSVAIDDLRDGADGPLAQTGSVDHELRFMINAVSRVLAS